MDEEIKRYAEYFGKLYLLSGIGLWKQADGEDLYIESMDESHLKNCIKLVRKDIAEFKKRKLESIMNKLLPIADQKLNELKKEYNSRI